MSLTPFAKQHLSPLRCLHPVLKAANIWDEVQMQSEIPKLRLHGDVCQLDLSTVMGVWTPITDTDIQVQHLILKTCPTL